MSARSAVAQQQGASEDMLAAVDDYQHSELSLAQRAALSLADAYLTDPAAMSESVEQEVAAQLTPVQVVEVVLKLMGFSSDKVMVALGLDFDEVRVFTM
jgi:alkylhydroperoxidase family enzyme